MSYSDDFHISEFRPVQNHENRSTGISPQFQALTISTSPQYYNYPTHVYDYNNASSSTYDTSSPYHSYSSASTVLFYENPTTSWDNQNSSYLSPIIYSTQSDGQTDSDGKHNPSCIFKIEIFLVAQASSPNKRYPKRQTRKQNPSSSKKLATLRKRGITKKTTKGFKIDNRGRPAKYQNDEERDAANVLTQVKYRRNRRIRTRIDDTLNEMMIQDMQAQNAELRQTIEATQQVIESLDAKGFFETYRHRMAANEIEDFEEYFRLTTITSGNDPILIN